MLIAGFDIEHFEPVSLAPELKLDYDNLVYACRSCNALKGFNSIRNPLCVLLSDRVQIYEDGRIEGLHIEAKKLIDIMGLDDPAYQRRRHLIQRIVRLAYEHDTMLYRTLLGFPSDLPDLSRSLPPFNSRSKGIEESYFKKFQAGTLPEIY